MAYLLVIQDGILSPNSAALGFLQFLEFLFFFSILEESNKCSTTVKEKCKIYLWLADFRKQALFEVASGMLQCLQGPLCYQVG